MNSFTLPGKAVPYILLVAGAVAVLLSCWMMIPVAINLPDSWFGAVIAVLLLGGGLAIIAKGFKRILREP